MPRYPIVFLDADNTLFDFTASQYDALKAALGQFGLPFSDAIARAYDEINNAVWKQYELGNLTRAELCRQRFEELLGLLREDRQKADALNTVYERYLAASSILLPGAEDFCRALAGECRLYILTNGSERIQQSRLALSPIRPYIARMFISQSLGSQKPEKAFFDAVFAALPLPESRKKEAVMVGDSLHSDMLGGLNAGLDTIWFNPGGAAEDPAIRPLYTARTYEGVTRLILRP